MAAMDFFSQFETLRAQTGQVAAIEDNQYKAGWAYIGATPPSVEQFNKVQQLSDQKAAWLFAQFKELAEQGGFELTADMVDALTKGVTAIASGRLLRTTVYTKVGATQYVSVNGGAPTTVNASVFNALPATKFVEVEVQGGGGGGGGVPSTTSSTVSASGSGGSGSYAKSLLTAGFAAVSIVVGAAGAGGAAGQTSGSNGGTSSFGSLVSAPGGVGGQSTAPSSPPILRGGWHTRHAAQRRESSLVNRGVRGRNNHHIGYGRGFDRWSLFCLRRGRCERSCSLWPWGRRRRQSSVEWLPCYRGWRWRPGDRRH